MRTSNHHAVQGGRVLRNVDTDGTYFEHSCIVCLQPPLGTVEGLGLGNTTFHYSSTNRGGEPLQYSKTKTSFEEVLRARRKLKSFNEASKIFHVKLYTD